MQTFVDQCIGHIEAVEGGYHRLVLVVGPSGSGKTGYLNGVAQTAGGGRLNVNLEIAKRLLDRPQRDRGMDVPLILGELMDDQQGGAVLLDNLEILFHPELEIDPLRLLQRLSRNRTIVAAWNGAIQGGHLIYAEAGHPEYRRYPIGDLSLVRLDRQPS